MARRPPPGAPALGRSVATRDPARRVAIFCEGATEEHILDTLRRAWRLAAVSVEIVGQRGDPSAVVAEAARRRRDLKGATIVVAFDRDEHDHWDSAVDRARQLGFVLAVSNPCVELWAILLHRDHTAPLDRHAAQRALRELDPTYDHARHPYVDETLVRDRHPEANRRAASLDGRAHDGGDPRGNPTTTFGLAITAFAPPR